jgi:hypothetical protein
MLEIFIGSPYLLGLLLVIWLTYFYGIDWAWTETGTAAITRFGQDPGCLVLVNYPGDYYCLFGTLLHTGTADHVIFNEAFGIYICMNIPWREGGFVLKRFLRTTFSADAAEIAWSAWEVNLGVAVLVEDQDAILTCWNTITATITQWFECFTVVGPGWLDRELWRGGWLGWWQKLDTRLSCFVFSITLKEVLKALISKKRSKIHTRLHHDNNLKGNLLRLQLKTLHVLVF